MGFQAVRRNHEYSVSSRKIFASIKREVVFEKRHKDGNLQRFQTQKIFKRVAAAEPSRLTAVSSAFRTFAAKLARRFLLMLSFFPLQ